MIMLEKEQPPKVQESKKLDQKLNNILSLIKETFTPIPDRTLQKFEDLTEQDLEIQLVQLLKNCFKTYKTEYHVRTRAGFVDIVVDDTIAIELKLATVPNLQRLIGQAMIYVKDYPRVGIVILDLGKVGKDSIQEYLDLLNGISNVKAISVVPSK